MAMTQNERGLQETAQRRVLRQLVGACHEAMRAMQRDPDLLGDNELSAKVLPLSSLPAIVADRSPAPLAEGGAISASDRSFPPTS
jgi:hypothetical protein